MSLPQHYIGLEKERLKR